MLLEDSPFLSFFGLGALFVVSPLNGITHGRHDRDENILLRLRTIRAPKTNLAGGRVDLKALRDGPRQAVVITLKHSANERVRVCAPSRAVLRITLGTFRILQFYASIRSGLPRQPSLDLLAFPASMMATPDPTRIPLPSRNPLPLSASQEGQVREIYYKRVRNLCTDEIRGELPSLSNRSTIISDG